MVCDHITKNYGLWSSSRLSLIHVRVRFRCVMFLLMYQSESTPRKKPVSLNYLALIRILVHKFKIWKKLVNKKIQSRIYFYNIIEKEKLKWNKQHSHQFKSHMRIDLLIRPSTRCRPCGSKHSRCDNSPWLSHELQLIVP